MVLRLAANSFSQTKPKGRHSSLVTRKDKRIRAIRNGSPKAFASAVGVLLPISSYPRVLLET